MCGQFVISGIKPHKLLYCKIYTINGVKRVSLVIYDWAIDKEYTFESCAYTDPFNFTISDDGKFVAFT